MRVCGQCGVFYPDEMRFCPRDGVALGVPVPMTLPPEPERPLGEVLGQIFDPTGGEIEAAIPVEEDIDTHPSGQLYVMPRIVRSRPLSSNPLGTISLPPPQAPTKETKLGRMHMVLLVVAALLIVLGTAALSAAIGWYARTLYERSQTSAPAPK